MGCDAMLIEMFRVPYGLHLQDRRWKYQVPAKRQYLSTGAVSLSCVEVFSREDTSVNIQMLCYRTYTHIASADILLKWSDCETDRSLPSIKKKKTSWF